MDQRKDATEATKAAHAKLAASLPKDTGEDMANATRGFLGTIPDANVPGAWSMAPFAFLNEAEPAETVNPSLWRQARLNL
jgi:alkyl sulfatase BDS1-like metallo-beta-lactamase superfamily hydrolase